MNGAGTTQGHTAAKLCAGQLQYVSEIPEQGHLRIAIERAVNPVHFELCHQDPLRQFGQAFYMPTRRDAIAGQNPRQAFPFR
jgi:hypothetical protein